MKYLYILTAFILITSLAQAQTKTSSKAPIQAQQRGVNVPKTISPSSFESPIVNGRLTMIRITERDANGNATPPTYSIICYEDPKFLNEGKAVDVRLTQLSFESFFNSNAAISSKKQAVVKYVQEKNLPLTEEKGWIAALKYFNSFY